MTGLVTHLSYLHILVCTPQNNRQHRSWNRYMHVIDPPQLTGATRGAQGRHGIKMKLTFVCVLAMAIGLSQMSSTSTANSIKVSGGEMRYDGK